MKFSFDLKDFTEKESGADKPAVIGSDGTLTWLEFSQQVNALCEDFKRLGLTELKQPVIVYGHKRAQMLVAMYAMMKLRITYIPIDIIYPSERLQKVLEISKSQLIINTTDTSLPFETISEIKFSKNEPVTLNKKGNTAFEKAPAAADPLIYIIFTSGSTGEPKGVQISTEAVQSFVRWMTTDFGFTASDVFINTAILSFDLSVFEVMTFSALGATLLLTEKDVSSVPKSFLQHIHTHKGTVLVATPSFALAYSRLKDSVEMQGVQTYLFCGEVLPHSTAKNLRGSFPNSRIINTYGPTEATVATTLVEIDDAVLNQFDPLPVGVSKPESDLLIEEGGEIVIVGPNVSMGYVNNPELNAAKFVQRNGQRAFKTGDTGYLQNGMLFFNGRNDDLVKLHGYRIELNEITAALNNLPYIAHGATIALKRDGLVKKIVSLVQLLENEEISVEKMKEDLAKTLPVYMIPSDIKVIPQIPLNANGKADKKLLTEIYLGNS
jgi:D-alanine--poly(phosphoribitol) ligase subunit 1